MAGDLTVRGVTREVVLDGEVSGPVTDPWGGSRIGVPGIRSGLDSLKAGAASSASAVPSVRLVNAIRVAVIERSMAILHI